MHVGERSILPRAIGRGGKVLLTEKLAIWSILLKQRILYDPLAGLLDGAGALLGREIGLRPTWANRVDFDGGIS